MTLEHKVVLVSGAASGMGAACSRLAAARGAVVLLVDRDEQRLGEIARELGMPQEVCDVANVASTGHLARRAAERFGRIDGLVNAAGVMQTSRYLDITPEDFDRIASVNLRGLFFLQQAVAREMAASGGGSIVSFSSTAGRVGRPLASHYAATKAAILNLTRSTAVALAPHGIRVNAVCPGLVETPMIQGIRAERTRLMHISPAEVQASWEQTIPMGRLGTPEEVAEIVVFLLSDASSYVTGEHIGATGGTDGS